VIILFIWVTYYFVILQAMDPQFSVLLDDPTAGGDKCGKHNKSDKTKFLVAIIVPITVFIVFLIAFLVVIWPRYEGGSSGVI
jgi:hypothetical protein